MRLLSCMVGASLIALPLPVLTALGDEAAPAPVSEKPSTQPVKIDPKPLSEAVKKGLDWLVKAQQNDGGWGQGDESAAMRGGQQGEDKLASHSNVADTAMAIQTLMRSGSTPSEGDHKTQIARGVDYICGQIDAADYDSLWVTEVRGTRVQSKIGQYVDTFLAAQVLSDVKGLMPTDAQNDRVATMLTKTLKKIEKNQQKDGGFAQGGWAPALGEGIAAKAVNQAAARGEEVDARVLERLDKKGAADFDEKSGKVAPAGSASVELYAVAGNAMNMSNADHRYAQREQELQKVLDAPTTQPEDRAKAAEELKDVQSKRVEVQQAQQQAFARMNDKQFVSGFGSNGGEEFLSYLNIGEAMVVRGDANFAEWDKKMTENLSRVQNDDGSWSGHHCITGKTFCTSSALMVLMVDRTKAPTGEAVQKR